MSAPTRFGEYLKFCARIREERGYQCEGCGRMAEEARERRLHVHHLWPVAKSGVDDALVASAGNVLLLCGWCHKMQHPGARSWPWAEAGKARGRALR